MMKFIALIAVAAISFGAAQAIAGGSCCAKKKSAMSCTDKMEGLSLTDEQKAKITDIEAACKADGSSKEACTKAKEDIRAVLTDEQRTQWDEACGTKSGAGCGEKSKS